MRIRSVIGGGYCWDRDWGGEWRRHSRKPGSVDDEKGSGAATAESVCWLQGLSSEKSWVPNAMGDRNAESSVIKHGCRKRGLSY